MEWDEYGNPIEDERDNRNGFGRVVAWDEHGNPIREEVSPPQGSPSPPAERRRAPPPRLAQHPLARMAGNIADAWKTNPLGVVTSALQGVTGWADEYAAAQYMNQQNNPVPGFPHPRSSIRTYDEIHREIEAPRRALQRDHPGVALGAEVVGALAGPVNVTTSALGTVPRLASRPAVRAGIAGALTGANQAVATGETVKERLDPVRIGTYSLTGAGAGAGLATAARVPGAIIDFVKWVYTRAGLTPDERAVRMIARRLQQAGVTPAELEKRRAALSRAGGGVQETIAEIGGVPLMRAARAVHDVAGPGQQIASDALNSRAEGVTGRVLNQAMRETLPKQTRSPRTFADAQYQLARSRRAQARSGYEAAYQQPITADNQQLLLNAMTQPGVGRRALNSAAQMAQVDVFEANNALNLARQSGGNVAAARKALREAQRAQRTLERLADGSVTVSPRSINPRVVDLYQRGLSGLVDDAGGAQTSMGRATANGQRSFNDLSDLAAPGLGDVRAQYGRSMRIEDFMNSGRRLFNLSEGEVDMLMAGHIPGQAARGLDARPMTTEELDGLMLGVMDAIESKIRSGDLAAVGRFMRNTAWQRNLETALGKKSARALMGRIGREVRMRQFQNSVQGNSSTTPRREDIQDMTTGESELGWMRDFIRSGGNIRAPLLNAAADAYDRFARPGIYNPEVNEALAKRLYAPASPARVRQLQQDITNLPRMRRDFGNALADVGGRVGAAYGSVAPERPESQAVAEISGLPSLGRAAQAAGRGDAGEAMTQGGVGLLALAPGAKPALAGLGLMGLGGVVGQSANAQERTRAEQLMPKPEGFDSVFQRGRWVSDGEDLNADEWGLPKPSRSTRYQLRYLRVPSEDGSVRDYGIVFQFDGGERKILGIDSVSDVDGAGNDADAMQQEPRFSNAIAPAPADRNKNNVAPVLAGFGLATVAPAVLKRLGLSTTLPLVGMLGRSQTARNAAILGAGAGAGAIAAEDDDRLGGALRGFGGAAVARAFGNKQNQADILDAIQRASRAAPPAVQSAVRAATQVPGRVRQGVQNVTDEATLLLEPYMPDHARRVLARQRNVRMRAEAAAAEAQRRAKAAERAAARDLRRRRELGTEIQRQSKLGVLEEGNTASIQLPRGPNVVDSMTRAARTRMRGMKIAELRNAARVLGFPEIAGATAPEIRRRLTSQIASDLARDYNGTVERLAQIGLIVR